MSKVSCSKSSFSQLDVASLALANVALANLALAHLALANLVVANLALEILALAIVGSGNLFQDTALGNLQWEAGGTMEKGSLGEPGGAPSGPCTLTTRVITLMSKAQLGKITLGKPSNGPQYTKCSASSLERIHDKPLYILRDCIPQINNTRSNLVFVWTLYQHLYNTS